MFGKEKIEQLEADVASLQSRLDEQAEATLAQQQRFQSQLMQMVAESVGERMGPAVQQIKGFEEQVGVLEMELNELRVDHNGVREALAQQVATVAELIQNLQKAMAPFTISQVEDVGKPVLPPAVGNRETRRHISRQQRR